MIISVYSIMLRYLLVSLIRFNVYVFVTKSHFIRDKIRAKKSQSKANAALLESVPLDVLLSQHLSDNERVCSSRSTKQFQ